MRGMLKALFIETNLLVFGAFEKWFIRLPVAHQVGFACVLNASRCDHILWLARSPTAIEGGYLLLLAPMPAMVPRHANRCAHLQSAFRSFHFVRALFLYSFFESPVVVCCSLIFSPNICMPRQIHHNMMLKFSSQNPTNIISFFKQSFFSGLTIPLMIPTIRWSRPNRLFGSRIIWLRTLCISYANRSAACRYFQFQWSMDSIFLRESNECSLIEYVIVAVKCKFITESLEPSFAGIGRRLTCPCLPFTPFLSQFWPFFFFGWAYPKKPYISFTDAERFLEVPLRIIFYLLCYYRFFLVHYTFCGWTSNNNKLE